MGTQQSVEVRRLEDFDKIPGEWHFNPGDAIRRSLYEIAKGGFMYVISYDDSGDVPEINIELKKDPNAQDIKTDFDDYLKLKKKYHFLHDLVRDIVSFLEPDHVDPDAFADGHASIFALSERHLKVAAPDGYSSLKQSMEENMKAFPQKGRELKSEPKDGSCPYCGHPKGSSTCQQSHP